MTGRCRLAFWAMAIIIAGLCVALCAWRHDTWEAREGLLELGQRVRALEVGR